MVQLLIRADDLGYCEAVNYGIEKSVKEGVIGSVGIMSNMPSVQHGLRLLEGTGVCLGQHTNLCLGSPCSAPEHIPSLVDEQGRLKSSKVYRDAWSSGSEFVVLEEAVLEIEAQYHRFVELTGHQPEYFEAHAVSSKQVERALEIVAEKYHLRYGNITPTETKAAFAGVSVAVCPMKCLMPEYNAFASLQEAVQNASRKMPNIYICHPGYLDAFLLKTSSLTVPRAYEVEMLCDKSMKIWLEKQGVRLITYNDL